MMMMKYKVQFLAECLIPVVICSMIFPKWSLSLKVWAAKIIYFKCNNNKQFNVVHTDCLYKIYTPVSNVTVKSVDNS